MSITTAITPELNGTYTNIPNDMKVKDLLSINWTPEGAFIDASPKEQVDHPSHYNQGKIEVVDAIADWGLNFQLGNVVKYTARAGHKDDILVDLEKAKWYLQYEIDRIKKEREA